MGRIKRIGIASATSGTKDLKLNNFIAPSLNSANKKLNSKDIPFNSKSLRYSKKKYENYLLNEGHPVGGSKAKFLKEALGYSAKDGKLLHANVKKAINGKIPNVTEITPYGIKKKFETKLKGKNGKWYDANVTIVVQKDNKRKTFKVVTITPRKKGK